PTFFHGSKEHSLSPFLENLKVFQAPLDPNLGDLGTKALSYAIPLSWSQKPHNGKLRLPHSFPSILSVCCVEATCGKGGTKLVTGTSTMYDSTRAPDAYPTPLAAWNGHASSFSTAGCQVLLIDGRVNTVSQKLAGD